MQRVNQREFDNIKRVYPTVQYVRTKHRIYIVARNEDKEAYSRCVNGNLSKRQQERQEYNQRRNARTTA